MQLQVRCKSQGLDLLCSALTALQLHFQHLRVCGTLAANKLQVSWFQFAMTHSSCKTWRMSWCAELAKGGSSTAVLCQEEITSEEQRVDAKVGLRGWNQGIIHVWKRFYKAECSLTSEEQRDGISGAEVGPRIDTAGRLRRRLLSAFFS